MIDVTVTMGTDGLLRSARAALSEQRLWSQVVAPYDLA